jgi:hypothetical protein
MILKFCSTNCLAIGILLALAGCNMNAQNLVRAGQTDVHPVEAVVTGEVNRWIQTVGIEGEEPSVSNITSTAVRTGYQNDFSGSVELVHPVQERERVKRNLENAGYFDVKITANGVTYQIETFADGDMRAILERHYPTADYTPHDCSRVIGTCAFSVTYGGSEPLHYLRTSEFTGGVWTDRVTYDPKRDPAGRTNLVEERRFSVAPTGIVNDMDRKLYLPDGVWEITTRHVERFVPKVEPIITTARPELAPRDLNDAGIGCTGGILHVVIGDERIEIKPGSQLTRAVVAETSVGLECTTDNGTMSVGTKCFRNGHLRASLVGGWAAMGCFEVSIGTKS